MASSLVKKELSFDAELCYYAAYLCRVLFILFNPRRVGKNIPFKEIHGVTLLGIGKNSVTCM